MGLNAYIHGICLYSLYLSEKAGREEMLRKLIADIRPVLSENMSRISKERARKIFTGCEQSLAEGKIATLDSIK